MDLVMIKPIKDKKLVFILKILKIPQKKTFFGRHTSNNLIYIKKLKCGQYSSA